jgi:CMP-N,N'-diacetyllegionaminic acid synthase
VSHPPVLALVPARGGSKGIPGKNVRPLAGKPLLAHTLEQALGARTPMRVVVSTDDDEIAEVAFSCGAEVVRRPDALAGDTASSESALLHALDALEAADGYIPELVVFLQCTSPLRRPGDIDGAVEALRAAGADSLLSVVASHRFLWRIGPEGAAESVNYDWRRRPRRQDRAAEYAENGSIYVFRPAVLRQGGNRLGGRIALYEMDEWSAVDIDSPADFELAGWLMERRAAETP